MRIFVKVSSFLVISLKTIYFKFKKISIPVMYFQKYQNN